MQHNTLLATSFPEAAHLNSYKNKKLLVQAAKAKQKIQKADLSASITRGVAGAALKVNTLNDEYSNMNDEEDTLNDVNVTNFLPSEVDVIKNTNLEHLAISFVKEICQLHEKLTKKDYSANVMKYQIGTLLHNQLRKLKIKNIQDKGSNISCIFFRSKQL